MSDSNDNNKGYNLGPFRRNRYFYGKLMTVNDFDTEQKYMNGKRHLLNRLVNGAGLICGLGLDDVEVSALGEKVIIKFKTGGAAIDCKGREIVVPVPGEKREIFVTEGDTESNLTTSLLDEDPYYLYLEYDERKGEMVSSALENSSCEENRITEDFKVIASKDGPGTPGSPDTQTIVCPDFTSETPEYDAKQEVKDWLKDRTSGLCTAPDEDRVFLLALNQGSSPITVDEAETNQYLSFVTNNSAFSELLACHLSDFGNPHKTLVGLDVEEEEGVVKVDHGDGYITIAKSNETGISNAITLDAEPNNHKILIGETHSKLRDNPHEVKMSQLKDFDANNNKIINLEKPTDDKDAANKKYVDTHSTRTDNPHGVKMSQLKDFSANNNKIINLEKPTDDKDAANKKYVDAHSARTDNPHQTTAEQVGALSISGGLVTGPIHIKTEEWSALSGNATTTYGVMGRLTQDLDTGSSYRTAGVVGVSEIEGKHGVYAKAPEGTHALYVQGSALFTGPKTGYVVDVFKNAGGKTLKTGDVVKLKGTPVNRFFGDNDKIPVAEVTMADKENDNCTIGIVDRKAIPEEIKTGKKSKASDPSVIKDGEELYVVTLGTYFRCKVDASDAPIKVGDLLTSSKNPGFAGKAADPKIGSIIGKALEPLEKGTGHIAVFVNIQ
jgi:hypothetical protein